MTGIVRGGLTSGSVGDADGADAVGAHAHEIVTSRTSAPSARQAVGPRTTIDLYQRECSLHTAQRAGLTRTVPFAFTCREVQRNLLVGVIVIVLIERARMRPGG